MALGVPRTNGTIAGALDGPAPLFNDGPTLIGHSIPELADFLETWTDDCRLDPTSIDLLRVRATDRDSLFSSGVIFLAPSYDVAPTH